MSSSANSDLLRDTPYFDEIFEIPPRRDGNGLRIGVVMSRFNPEICEGLLFAAVAELRCLGVADADITLITVPGALEIPFALQKLARRGDNAPDAQIALGAVIRGETYHFEAVSNDACRGVMETQLQTRIPVANGILTCENEDQARVRMEAKGRDCARTAVEMARLKTSVQDAPKGWCQRDILRNARTGAES